MIKLKNGVLHKNLVILAAVANVARELPHDVVITSGNDSKHKVGSRHYTNQALDIRSKNFPSLRHKQEFLRAVLLRLGPDYEGFLENEGQAQEHFHVEWDPHG